MKARVSTFGFRRLAGIVLAGILCYFLAIYVLVRVEAGRDDVPSADLIIVFGAAQYNGRPSPVYKARLDHGVEVFGRNDSPRVITTGGHGMDPRFTEAEVGKAYLIRQGIPADRIDTEDSGLTTLDSIRGILQDLQDRDPQGIVVVSDGFHLFRIKRIFRDHRIVVHGSPAPDSPIESNWRTRTRASVREVVGYTAYMVREKLGLPIPTDRWL